MRAIVSRTTLAVLAAGLLAGCASKPTPEPRYYVLEPLDPATAAVPGVRRDPPLALELVAPRLPQYLERAQIVTRAEANRLELAELERWGGNLAKNLARVLADDLSALLATPDVRLGVRRAAPAPDARIEVEVTRFERGADRRVHLEARWRILSGDRARLLATRTSRLASAPLAAGAPMGRTVERMSELAGELARRIAAALVERLP